MNFFNRAIKSIFRQPVKSCVFLLLVILLGILVSGSISVRQAIINTDANLRRRMPAVVTIMDGFSENEGAYTAREHLTSELLRTMGSFPEVQAFDYAIDMTWGVTAPGMIAWQDASMYSPLPLGYDVDLGMGLSVMGVSTPEFIDVRHSFVELVRGRSFDASDMISDNERYPVLITTGFAEVNHLDVGSHFEVQVVVFDYTEDASGILTEHRERPPLVEETFLLEVIGIFNIMLQAPSEDAPAYAYAEYILHKRQAMHRVYVPNALAEQLFHARAQGWVGFDAIFFQNIFLLNSPTDTADFARRIEDLPGNWRVVDYSRGFDDISISMNSMLGISDFILLGTIGATFLLVGLLVLLFLYDRKHEIGVYLALGEHKRKIVWQIIMEVVTLTLIGMTLALFAGNILANRLSHEMLRRDLAQPSHHRVDEIHLLEELGYRFELTHEEMLATYEVRLNVATVLYFYVIGLGVVLLATVIPIIRVVRLHPKKVLL